MGRRKATPLSGEKRKRRPATTPEARENQLVALAFDLVEQRLIDGTASAQETTALIKAGTTKARLEAEKLRKETQLLKAKTDAVESAQRVEELYAEAIKAMKTYTGREEDTDDQDIL